MPAVLGRKEQETLRLEPMMSPTPACTVQLREPIRTPDLAIAGLACRNAANPRAASAKLPIFNMTSSLFWGIRISPFPEIATPRGTWQGLQFTEAGPGGAILIGLVNESRGVKH